MINHSSRAHARLSASSAHRWLVCPPSAVAAELYDDPGSPYALEGTLAHEVAEEIARGYEVDPNEGLWKEEGTTAEMVHCAKAYKDYIWEQVTTADAEILLEKRVDFSPWVPDGFGTCDCIVIDGSTLHVIDYKYGKGVAVEAEGNPQTRLYMLGALHDYGWLYDVDTVVGHIFQPRLNSFSREQMSVADLYKWADEVVKPAAALAAKGKGNYMAGGHCRFCLHAGRCKALQDTSMGYVRGKDFTAAVPQLTPVEMAEAIAMRPVIELWLDKVGQAALDLLLAGHDVPGYKVVAGRSSREWTDKDRVELVLNAEGYTQDAITETTLLSVAKMEKALGKKKVAELLPDLIQQKAGKPTIAPVTDKRPAYTAADDFENLD